MTPLLEARDVSRVYGSGPQATLALDRFSLTVGGDVPTFTALAGESGSGKTTLARLLLGFTQPTSGEILYRGKNLWKMNRHEWLDFRHELQAVFQDPFEGFNPFYKVDHLLTVPMSKFRLAKSDVDTRWDDDEVPPARAELTRRMAHGCQFADRCPAVMQICSEVAPPLYRMDAQRAAACFLYRDMPTLESGAISEVLETRRILS